MLDVKTIYNTPKLATFKHLPTLLMYDECDDTYTGFSPLMMGHEPCTVHASCADTSKHHDSTTKNPMQAFGCKTFFVNSLCVPCLICCPIWWLDDEDDVIWCCYVRKLFCWNKTLCCCHCRCCVSCVFTEKERDWISEGKAGDKYLRLQQIIQME